MDVLVESPEPNSADLLRDLHTELLGDGRWRGRVTLVESPAPEEALGPVLDAVRVALDPQTLAPLVAAVIAYVRYRTTDIEVMIRRTGTDTQITLSGKRLRRIDHSALTGELDRVLRALEPPDSGDDRP